MVLIENELVPGTLLVHVKEYLKEYDSHLCVQKNGMTFWTK